MSYNPLTIGQQPMSSSQGVVIASDQSPVSVTGTVTITGTPSVSGQVGSSIIGWVPIQPSNTSFISLIQSSVAVAIVSGSIAASIVGQLPAGNAILGAVAASISGTVATTLSGTPSISGTVIAAQGGNAGVASSWPVKITNGSQSVNVSSSSMLSVSVDAMTSIVGTYAEDAGHTSADKGVFVLAVRNDTVTSVASADLDYTLIAVDSAGRTVSKPFAPEESRVYANASAVSAVSVLAVAAAGAGLRNYITDITIANTGAAGTLVTFTDGDASVLGRTMAPAGGGSNIVGMAIPMKTSVNQPFNIVPATATSILYATVWGYKAP